MESLFSMAAFPSLLILSALMGASAQQQRYSNISLGSSLTTTTNSSWLSPSGLYAFGFYKLTNGYAVGIFIAGIPEKTLVWTANRDEPVFPTNAVLLLTDDGRIILQQEDRDEVNIVNSARSVASASMLDSGNFVLYDSSRRITWQSFDYPTDTLLPGQLLQAGAELVSSASKTNPARGIFRLAMQADGNLVQYPVEISGPNYAYYASGTMGTGNNVSLNLDNNGHLYLFNGSAIISNLTRGQHRKKTIYLMRIDVDGIFRLYYRSLDPQGNWTKEWSPSEDKCAPLGLCGLNGYCIQLDTAAECECLPGFDHVNPGNWTSGCERNFPMEGCKANNQNVSYQMRSLGDTVWEDANYAILGGLTKEDCAKACLEDCNCDAAFLEDGNCKKQRLPLRFGRRVRSNPIVALIKVNTITQSTRGASSDSGKEIKKVIRLDVLIISISLFALATLILAISGIYIHRNHVGRYKKISHVELIEGVGLRAFTYPELLEATNEFKEELGRGASGTVYKGILSDNRSIVAVKRLDKELEEGEKEFETEMKVIGKTHHRNLVKLLGYCHEGANWLLVYEYMKNGSLADILFNHENRLCWEERIRVACDIARGVLYLHEECETQIIHCDIKPQNILMDEHRCAKISDFGLAKLLKKDQTNTYTGIRGTLGYVAPEWHRKLPVTVKADVYSFGIVLLEIICGRKSVDWSLSEDEAILEEWVYNVFETGEVYKLVGDEKVDKRKLDRMIKIGIWCIQDEPSLRPSMKKVLLMLEGTVEIPLPPSPTSFLSAI
ncbi:G-type lectin S-receptor-like serine/threonine-protein kinase LECRK3 [Olea europaea var. sylvestris]|uniref:G-type lectin S-receptor-like serine/threonine-protein kinase LECRK3 n=1 Tax=Olea europaea var. sylvestris TaxID=158386 RepID=UPI000C1D4136|nr:G-type lectin S-receptor-like serine/threonine-protein kinase LECRK3 [Olea europaea var. sylvestris]